ncbi:MAG: hypothetical protein ACYCW6_24010 [Candidatus Xenobia bacterium]
MKHLRVMVLVALCLALPTWGATLTSNTGGFTVQLPSQAAKPKTETQVVQTPAGPIKYNLFVADMGHAACGVGYNDFTVHQMRHRAHYALLREMRDNCLRSIKGKLSTQAAWSLHGHPGLAFRFTAPTAHGRIYARTSLLLVGNRLYQIQFYSHDKADLERADTLRFFHSFSLLH